MLKDNKWFLLPFFTMFLSFCGLARELAINERIIMKLMYYPCPSLNRLDPDQDH